LEFSFPPSDGQKIPFKLLFPAKSFWRFFLPKGDTFGVLPDETFSPERFKRSQGIFRKGEAFTTSILEGRSFPDQSPLFVKEPGFSPTIKRCLTTPFSGGPWSDLGTQSLFPKKSPFRRAPFWSDFPWEGWRLSIFPFAAFPLLSPPGGSSAPMAFFFFSHRPLPPWTLFSSTLPHPVPKLTQMMSFFFSHRFPRVWRRVPFPAEGFLSRGRRSCETAGGRSPSDVVFFPPVFGFVEIGSPLLGRVSCVLPPPACRVHFFRPYFLFPSFSTGRKFN